ncbi:hypothetical protein L9F63_014360 [Diploptera punctata]|uniref:Exosome complex component 10 homolog n=1 Tax=Diploptera punctata TaxID=6984 RepID=A0AAD8A7Z5_DIPPU|nr:hypothetical protein L9F63_014360 [Diploptera punctata]
MEAGCSSSGNEENKIENEENTNKEVIPGFQTLDAFRQAAFKKLMQGTRNSNNLPTGKNWDYYTSFPVFKKIMDAEGKRVLELISMLLLHQGMKGNIVRREFEEKFDLIIDANDSILERVGCNLDEMSGIKRNPEPVLVEAVGSCTRPVSGSWNKICMRGAKSIRNNRNVVQPVRLLTAKNIQRPQIKFKDKIDNTSAPFEPRIKDKPNSLKPLSVMLEIAEDGMQSFSHPYEYELNRFKPSAEHLKRRNPRLPAPVDNTPLIIVEREEQLAPMLQDLAKYPEIAVDLEHHGYRSFQGITCLMQISTRDTDYIIDTLELRDKLHCLNDIFTKPSIIKVFHGADHDVEWLQRDLCLYVVNMFDTHQAAKALNFAHLSLAFLLKHYCNVIAYKHFQLADWRIRPLPQELIMYARDDTHYLLYIYDMMHTALLDAANGQDNLLQSVFQLSTHICKTKYEKPILTDDSHMVMYRRNKKLFDNRQLFALKELYRWRDKIAREEDESIGYVLPNHMMLQIAETLPREMQEQPLVQPILEEESQVRPTTEWKVNLDGPLHCPHDLAHNQDFRDDLPTLMGGTLKISDAPQVLASQPSGSVTESDEAQDEHTSLVTFVCPYERYKKLPADDNEVRIERLREHFFEVSAKVEEQRQNKRKIEEQVKQEQSIAEPKPAEPEDKISLQSLRQKPKRKRKGKNNVQSTENSIQTPDSKRVKFEDDFTLKKSKKKKKKNNPPGEGFQPFDYNKINYSRFQGGSNTGQANNKVQEKFKPKGKKAKRSGKKSMTFNTGKW